MDLLYDRSETVCFSGHRMIQAAALPHLRKCLRTAIRTAYTGGYRFFVCGGARGFDTLAAQEVIRFRQEFPDVKLVIAVPCRSQADKWAEKNRALYRTILDQADETIILSDFYFSGCMQNRNRFMVDAASFCICYMTRFEGGTWSTVRYALRCGILVKNLAMPEKNSSVLKEMPWNYTCISLSASENVNIARLYPFRRWMNRRTRIWMPFSGKQRFGAEK